MEHANIPPQAHASTMHMSQMGLQQVPIFVQPITDTQVAHARLNKQGHRPLGRTQSAPLPLGHPMLTGVSGINIGQTHYENSDAERQAYEQQHQMLTQKIRQTVLTRSGGSMLRGDPQVVLEEDDSTGEVIDLTDKKQPPRTVLNNSAHMSSSQSCIDPSVFTENKYMQKQRDIFIRISKQVINR